ncbi:thioredoxin family protein [Marinigracilibium pacificum]|uniref:Thioredoxin family protein n=1 Tax=Marinigracilibium pacificum TaxID=2729599 RepID=A0A848IYN9_9BACT|nr:thioredoxin family protein [Marinigracilibium pacificum]NMM47109.1 thioredoxin family protein [Marinigracilibium pacificum]
MKHLYTLILLFTISLGASAQGYEVGDNAIDFKLKNIDGKTVSLANYNTAKGFIVIFTCNSCPYAKLYEDRIIALNNKFANQGYPVIAINPNDKDRQPEDSFDKMKVRAKEKGFTFPYLYDETQEVAMAYGATKTPHVYLLKKEGGNFKVVYIGAIDDNPQNPNDVKTKYVENAIEEVEAGKSVSEHFTRAIGCTIKWKS